MPLHELSYVDSFVAGFLGVIGVVAGVLLDRRMKEGERKELKAQRIELLANRVLRQLHGLLTHVGVNQAKLTTILAENLEGKSPSRVDFKQMITDALSAYPLPSPEEIPFPKDDSYGYPLVAVSAQISDFVREANAAAEELKAGKQDAERVSNFVVMNDRAVSKDIIIHTAETQFRAYLETLEDIYGRKLNPKERDAGVKKLVSDLDRSYSLAVTMGESLNGYRKSTTGYLRNIGW